MTWEQFLQELWYLLPVLSSALLGFVIGLERKFRLKEAGIRTHTIVCIGSALMMVVSKYAFGGQTADAARIAAQIVSGVGFLGAGIIVYHKQEIHGLTTAAGVWATAGVGMACGGGLYIVAVGATVILIGVQCIFHLNIKPFRAKKYFTVNINFRQDGDASAKIKEIFGAERFYHLVMERREDGIIYSAKLKTDKELSSAELDQIIGENPFICSIERCDDI